MKNITGLLLFAWTGCLLLVLLGCESAPEPQKIGVFVSSNRGLLELAAYGEQNGSTSYSFRKTKDVPRVGKITAFYVNMPDAKITNSKIFWVTKFAIDFDENNFASLNMSMEAGKKNNVYRIKSSNLEDKKGGFALLKIGMPLGTPDRMYVIQVTE